MDFTELASRVDPALPNIGARSREPSAKRQRTASVERIRPSSKLRRPSSFERIRPPQVYERGRAGFYEQRPRYRSSSGWRFASSSRSSRGSFVSLIDPKIVLGRDMEEQRERDISLLNERSPTVSRFGNPRRSGHKKQPSEGSNRNRRPEVPSRVTQGTMVVYREGQAEDQPTEDSLRKSREGIFESTTDVDRETLLIRKRRDKKGKGTKGLPGTYYGSDFDPTASSSKGALILYQGKKARDGTHQGSRKRFRSNNGQASVGDFRESFSAEHITIRRGERRNLNRFQKDRYDGDISSGSDNRRSSDDSQYHSPESSPHNRAKTRVPIRTYEGKAPSTRRRRKGTLPQRREPALEKSTKRRVQQGHQQTTGNNNNDYGYTNPSSARLEGSDAHQAPETGSPLADSKQLIRGKASPADMGMRTLLVYRAVLFAMLCALAADTSCVFETELGRRVVQVL